MSEVKTFPPTEEQQAIIRAAQFETASIMIEALAGTGKTTTLELLSSVLPTRNVLALAFNKKIVSELETRLPPHFLIKSMNSLGHKAFAQALGKYLKLEEKKIAKLVTEFSKSIGNLSDDEWADLRNLVVRARTLGLVPSKFPQARKALLSDDAWGWDLVADSLGLGGGGGIGKELVDAGRSILTSSCEMALSGIIDFDDQIYMSTLFMGVYPRVHTILVDERQDLSPLNCLQIKKCNPTRIICVGDTRQAIYAFRGADARAKEKIRELKSEWIDLPLNTTFRCPKAIVARQQEHAPGYTAAESNQEGKVIDLRSFEKWTIGKEEKEGSCFPNAILCRNNAPLVSLAFALIKKRIGINMLGRDFGKSLKSILKKVCGEVMSLPVEEVAQKLREWSEKERRLAIAADKEERVGRIMDQYESLTAVIDSGEVRTLSDIHSWLEELFSEKKGGQIILSSGHKSKGLEWNTVLHLDPWRIPSKWARLARDEGDEIPYQQEMNLKYVIETRAKSTLVLADLERFE